jgi:hypothetical protein
MNDFQTTYRRNEGADYPHSDPWAATPRGLLFRACLLSGLSGLFIGWLSFAIFVTGI